MAVMCVSIICDVFRSVALSLRDTRLLTVTAIAPAPNRIRAFTGSLTRAMSPPVNVFVESASRLRLQTAKNTCCPVHRINLFMRTSACERHMYTTTHARTLRPALTLCLHLLIGTRTLQWVRHHRHRTICKRTGESINM